MKSRVHGRPRVALPVVLFGVLCLPAVLAGCTGLFALYEAEVPETFLGDGWREVDRDRGGSWLGEGMRWAQVTYQVEPTSDVLGRGPYPASLMVMSIDTPAPLDRDHVITNLEEQVRENSAEQGVELRENTRRSGERVLASGVRSLWFTYDARIGSGASLFAPGHDAKVIGEAWFDERSKITVVVVGLAQVQGGTVTGQQYRDESHWHRMVADPEGAVASPPSEKGLVYNVRSHGS